MRALRAKIVITCQHALSAFVLICQRVLRSYVLSCQRALRAYVLTCQRTLRAFQAFGFTYQIALSASHIKISISIACLCNHLSTWLASSCAYVQPCLESLASHDLCGHVINCQHALVPQ